MENNGALSRPLQYPQSLPLPSTYGVPMPLNLGCKVFISHSGCDKEFVRFLYVALCRRYQDKEVGFFDEESLPTAEAISMDNILEEARRSQLGVLVLTEDFFVKSPNPMRELEAFTSGEVRLLPLFFRMSVDEFKNKIQTRSWEDRWRNWSTKQLGGRSNVEEVVEMWRHSLDLVTTFSGLERKKIANSDQEYIQKIVDKVTRIIPPTILFSEKEVCGKIRLCQIINNMYEKCAAKHTSSIDRTPITAASTSASSDFEEENSGYTTLDLVGIYGFSGLGKTTLCKCLCDFYFAEFNGRVYYVDVGSSCADHKVKNLSSDEQFSSMKDPIFLAIDNILPYTESQEEVEFYLNYKFQKGSKILITSKSENILRNLASLHSCSFIAEIEYMPALTPEEARDIFVHEFPGLHKHGCSNLEDDVMECVKMCTIHETRYHPLMLKSLAAFVKWDNWDLNLDLKQRLKKLRLEGITDKESALEKVYTMLDKPYALLYEDEKRVFLDLVLFYNATSYTNEADRWIKMLHSHLREEKMKKIILKLQHLCFLEKTKYDYTFLDLVVGFGKHKAEQGAHSSRFGHSGHIFFDCQSAVTELDGLSKYTGYFYRQSTQRRLWNVTGLGNDVQKVFAGVETSKCKALITAFKASRANPAAGLADVQTIRLADAQHIGPFITALFKAQPENLQNLEIHCKEGGDCGCDQNAPLFGLLPMPRSNGDFIHFTYRCSQVKALASLGQWHGLEWLDLGGCTNVEIWPDFAAMTLLNRLNLSSTSLKEWPAGVQHLPHLEWLNIRGCQQLPAEELMKVVSFELQPATPGIVVCAIHSLAALKDDLRHQSRDRCSVANALDGVYVELVALFDRSSWSLPEAVVLQLVIAIMYDVLWPFNGDQADVAQELHIRTKLERLLCSERFLSLPFRAYDRCFLLSHSRSWTSWPRYVYSAWDLCDMRAGEEEESEMIKDHVMRAMALKGIALGGAGGCSLACFNYATPVNDHLRDTITDYRRSLTQLQTQTCGCSFFEVDYTASFESLYMVTRRLGQEELSVLERRVREAVVRLAREVGSVAAEFGEIVVYTIMLAQRNPSDSSHY